MHKFESLCYYIIARLIAVSVLVGLIQTFIPASPDESGPLKTSSDNAEREKWTQETLSSLSLEERVGQILQIRYFADNADFENPGYTRIREEIQKYHVGSMVLGMRFNRLGPVRTSTREAVLVTNQLQKDSKLPLLIAADLERGLASRLNNVPAFPWPMAFGAIGDSKNVESFGARTAREARAIGIHWVFAPVADVNSNPSNPAINTRSFGEDSNEVGIMVEAFIRGAHSGGLLVTAKHFPGSGDTADDPHYGMTSISGSTNHIDQVEMPPFRRAIAANVDSIMLAHARVPALEPDPKKIATVSPRVVHGVLQEQLGFKGVVVTDALEMQGLAGIYDPKDGSPTARAAVDALRAGCDVISIPADLDGAFNAILNAIRSGEIPQARIDESVRKILRMKAAVGLNESRFVDVDRATSLTTEPEDMAFAQEVADQAVTLVRDNKQVVPIARSTLVGIPSSKGETNSGLAVILLSEALTDTDGKEFENAVKDRQRDAAVYYFDNRHSQIEADQIASAVANAEKVVIAIYAAHNRIRHITAGGKLLTSFGPLGPSGQLLGRLLENSSQKTAVVVLGNPYLIVNYPEIQTYICTYAMPSTSEISAVKALFGEIQNQAKLPITLPGIAPRGFSLPWPTQPVTPRASLGESSTRSLLNSPLP